MILFVLPKGFMKLCPAGREGIGLFYAVKSMDNYFFHISATKLCKGTNHLYWIQRDLRLCLPLLLSIQLYHVHQQCPFHKELLSYYFNSLFWNSIYRLCPYWLFLNLLPVLFFTWGGSCRIVYSIQSEVRTWIYRDCTDCSPKSEETNCT